LEGFPLKAMMCHRLLLEGIDFKTSPSGGSPLREAPLPKACVEKTSIAQHLSGKRHLPSPPGSAEMHVLAGFCGTWGIFD
jgi:hypothetical protein